MPRVRTITQKVIVSAPPGRVYAALTNARQHAAFTGAAASGVARVGARFTAWDGYISGVHRRLVKNRTICQDWRTTAWPAGADDSQLTISLKAVTRGTEIRMVHANVPAEQAEAYRQGWIDYYWKPLAAYFSARQRT